MVDRRIEPQVELNEVHKGNKSLWRRGVLSLAALHLTQKMGRLDYDTGAFSFFALAICLACLIPLTLSALKTYRKANKKVDVSNIAPTSNLFENAFVARQAKKKREAVLQAQREASNSAFRWLAFLGVCWALFFGYLMMQEAGADIQKFDPFEILGISHSANEIDIKKAYKKLSLVHHPDRWANKDKAERALAETRFIMVAKAYEALTDPIARENFQKYGNPDGRQALEMSIGLPAWLLEKDNQSWVIASYLLLSIIVFPAGVMLITANAAKSGAQPKRLFPDTDELLRVGIRNDTRSFISMAELFALSAEFRTLVYRSDEEKKAVLELRNQLVRDERYPLKASTVTLNLFKQMPSLKNSEGNEKALVLVFVHLNREHARLNEELMTDLEYILTCSPIILRAMVNHARATCNVGVLSMAIFFQQHLNQALMPNGWFLLQFPHIESADVEFMTQQTLKRLNIDSRPGKRQRTLLQEIFANSREQKIPILDDNKHQKEFNAVLNRIPFKDLKVEIGTLKEVKNPSAGKSKDLRKNEYVFEERSAQGDFIHVICDLVEQNILRKVESGVAVAHTPFVPHDVKEEWYIIIAGGPPPKGFNNIMGGENKVTAFGVVEDDYHQKLRLDLSFSTSNNANDWLGSADWPVGKHELLVMVFPNAYLDNQKMFPIEINLTDPKLLPKFRYHEEDERLQHEPASLLEMLQNQTEPQVDSDFDEPDENGHGEEVDVDANDEDVD